jgi:polyhydroxybutyrate depolymerase
VIETSFGDDRLGVMTSFREYVEGFERHELQHEDRLRSYLLFRPDTAGGAAAGASSEQGPMPLVLAFHGSGVDGRQMANFCGLHELAATERFMVVYPNGTGHTSHTLSWNAGNCCGMAMLRGVDDVGFVRRIIEDVSGQAPIDPSRIYAVGFSNGAMMAYRLGMELSETFAAIAPVSGPMGFEEATPSRPVPVLHFHGTIDEFAPFEGGVGKRSVSRCNFRSAEQSVAAWVAANGCDPTPTVVKMPTVVEDGTEIVRKHYTGGRDGSEVIFYTIEGGGHTWPGRSTPFSILGKSTKNIRANDLIWAFFERHRR